MTAPNFPNNPTIGQQFVVGNNTFQWDGEKWKALSNADNSLRTQLAASDSTVLVGGVEAGDLGRKYLENVSLMDYAWLAVGDDWTSALQAAASVANKIDIPEGLFKFNFLNLPANTWLDGKGFNTVIQPIAPNVRCAIGADSGSPSIFIDNITITNIRFQGEVETAGFAEQTHLTSFNGVRNLLIERCWFIGFRGDGLYIGSGNAGGEERHNHNVTVRKCFFDGINKDNRNGISIIDGDGVLIDDCYFTRCSRGNMPGPIDIEPDSFAFHVVRNITVRNCKFFDTGGNVAAVSFFLPGVTYTTPPDGFLVEGNYIENCAANGVFLGYQLAGGISEATHAFGLIVRDNYIKNSARPFSINNAKATVIHGNTFNSSAEDALIGFNTVNDNVIDAVIEGNRFIRCGSIGGNGLTVFKASRIAIKDNEFNDCGAGVPGAANAILFNTGTSSQIDISGNTFLSPTGKTQIAIQKEASHTLTPSTNRLLGNNFNNLSGAAFTSHENDVNFTSYTPVISGADTEGVGTYTVQMGRWRRIGKQVFFEVEITQTAHTGAGLLQISLPVSPFEDANNSFVTIPVALTGVGTTGGQIGLINPIASSGGVIGSIRCFSTGTGTLLQTTVPSGAATYRASGTYMAK